MRGWQRQAPFSSYCHFTSSKGLCRWCLCPSWSLRAGLCLQPQPCTLLLAGVQAGPRGHPFAFILTPQPLPPLHQGCAMFQKVDTRNRKRIQGVRIRTCLAVQWLRLLAPPAGDLGSTPGQGTRSPMPQLKFSNATAKTEKRRRGQDTCREGLSKDRHILGSGSPPAPTNSTDGKTEAGEGRPAAVL